MQRIARFYMPTLIALATTGNVQAGEWQHTLTPYLWGSSMSGKTALGTPLGPVEVDVDAGFGDILRNLKFGAMVGYQGERDRLLVVVDAIYMDLKAKKSVTAGPVQIDGAAGVKQTALEVDVGYQVAERTHLFAGLRYNDLSPDVKITTTGPGPGITSSASGSKSWVDPVVGAVTAMPLAERWSLRLRGDIGGFGVGSSFVWQVMTTVHWQFKENMQVVGGYRFMDTDYKSGSGTNLFKYDVATSGPGIGVSFRL